MNVSSDDNGMDESPIFSAYFMALNTVDSVDRELDNIPDHPEQEQEETPVPTTNNDINKGEKVELKKSNDVGLNSVTAINDDGSPGVESISSNNNLRSMSVKERMQLYDASCRRHSSSKQPCLSPIQEDELHAVAENSRLSKSRQFFETTSATSTALFVEDDDDDEDSSDNEEMQSDSQQRVKNRSLFTDDDDDDDETSMKDVNLNDDDEERRSPTGSIEKQLHNDESPNSEKRQSIDEHLPIANGDASTKSKASAFTVIEVIYDDEDTDKEEESLPLNPLPLSMQDVKRTSTIDVVEQHENQCLCQNGLSVVAKKPPPDESGQLFQESSKIPSAPIVADAGDPMKTTNRRSASAFTAVEVVYCEAQMTGKNDLDLPERIQNSPCDESKPTIASKTKDADATDPEKPVLSNAKEIPEKGLQQSLPSVSE